MAIRKVTIMSDTDTDGYFGASSMSGVFRSSFPDVRVTYVPCASSDHAKRENLGIYNADILILVDLSITPKMMGGLSPGRQPGSSSAGTTPTIIIIDHHISSLDVLDQRAENQYCEVFPTDAQYGDIMTRSGVFEIGNALLLLDVNYSASRSAEQLAQYITKTGFFNGATTERDKWKQMMESYVLDRSFTPELSQISRVIDSYDRGIPKIWLFDAIMYHFLITECNTLSLAKAYEIYMYDEDHTRQFLVQAEERRQILEPVVSAAIKDLAIRTRRVTIAGLQSMPGVAGADADGARDSLEVIFLRDCDKRFRFHLVVKLLAEGIPVILYIPMSDKKYLLIIRTPFVGRKINAYGLAAHLSGNKDKCGGHFHASSCVVTEDVYKKFIYAGHGSR